MQPLTKDSTISSSRAQRCVTIYENFTRGDRPSDSLSSLPLVTQWPTPTNSLCSFVFTESGTSYKTLRWIRAYRRSFDRYSPPRISFINTQDINYRTSATQTHVSCPSRTIFGIKHQETEKERGSRDRHRDGPGCLFRTVCQKAQTRIS